MNGILRSITKDNQLVVWFKCFFYSIKKQMQPLVKTDNIEEY